MDLRERFFDPYRSITSFKSRKLSFSGPRSSFYYISAGFGVLGLALWDSRVYMHSAPGFRVKSFRCSHRLGLKVPLRVHLAVLQEFRV